MTGRVLLRTMQLLVVMIFLAACESGSFNQQITTGSFTEVTGRDLRIVTGQTIYVPAYSEVLLGGRDTRIELVVTLAVHNTDLDSPIILQSVRYYDTDGQLVRNYVDEPIEVSSLATTGFLVQPQESVSGWGANFVVEWVAEEPVSEPIVEAVMVSRTGNQGISMISIGRVIQQTQPDSNSTETDE